MDVDVEVLDDLFVARPDLLEDRGDVQTLLKHAVAEQEHVGYLNVVAEPFAGCGDDYDLALGIAVDDSADFQEMLGVSQRGAAEFTDFQAHDSNKKRWREPLP